MNSPEEVLRTFLEFKIDKTRVLWGEVITVSGKLVDERGNPVPFMNVEIQQLIDTEWKTIKIVRTRFDGTFSTILTIPIPGKYEFRAYFRRTRASPEIYESSTSDSIGVVSEKHYSKLTIDWSSPTRYNKTDVRGQSCSLFGTLSCDICGGLVNKRVYFERDGVAIGASFTVSAGKKDFRTLTPDTSGWCPYLYCSAVCTVAPTTGSLTVLRIRSKENITKMFDAYEIRDTLKHLSEVVEW